MELTFRPAEPVRPTCSRWTWALQMLAAEDPRKAQVVEMRFFGGLSVDETAEAPRDIGSAPFTPTGHSRGAWLYRTLV